jgi:rare lipoprotein A (peptidoglycan hydrolase)
MRMPTTLGLSLALLVAPPAAMAKQHASAHHHAAPNVKLKASTPPPRTRSAKKTAAAKRLGPRRERERAVQRPRPVMQYAVMQYTGMQYTGMQYAGSSLPPPDRYIAPVTATSQGQIGRAAWYGNHHVGRLTATGERLDTVYATAAHRSLPLNSLVRVTNLRNGRAVVVRINDRGPVSRSLLIDMSPRAAAAIDMINDGIADVMIEPVVPAGGVGSTAR